MVEKNSVPVPKENLHFIDVHCHLPFPRPARDVLPSDIEQYNQFFKMGGLYMITSTIDMQTLKITLKFKEKVKKWYGFTCGWAPQTVTYTTQKKYESQWKDWVKYINEKSDDFLAIGEIGLDFHHAKTLDQREKQIEELKKIFENTVDLDKPYVLHVRNAAHHEMDKEHPKHRFNQEDGANKEILEILAEYKIPDEKTMWHCFSGPKEYGLLLSKRGFKLSVPSSAFGFKRWQEATQPAALDSLLTETDSYYQHPYKRGPVNVPANVRYSIAAIAYTHDLAQKEVSIKTVQNAIEFFKLKIGNS